MRPPLQSASPTTRIVHPGETVKTSIVAAAAALTLLSACSGHEPSATRTATPATSPTGSPSVAPGPRLAVFGSYQTNFTGNEHYGPRGHQLPTGVPNAGIWQLTLAHAFASFSSTGNGANFPLGPRAEITATRLIVTADPACPDLYPDKLTTGVYSYRLSGATLVFHLISDSCLDRAATLVSHPWHRTSG
jgi:hypothetical protein